MHLLHRYAHVPATIVLNKIDLLPRRSDLLRLAEIFTDGTVSGVKIDRSNVSFGSFDNKSKNLITNNEEKKKLDEGFLIHHTSSIPNRDEQWHALYKYSFYDTAYMCIYNKKNFKLNYLICLIKDKARSFVFF